MAEAIYTNSAPNVWLGCFKITKDCGLSLALVVQMVKSVLFLFWRDRPGSETALLQFFVFLFKSHQKSIYF